MLGDRRAEVGLDLGGQRRLEQVLERPQLALRGAADRAGAREGVPRAGERDEAGPAAVAVGGQHRADAAAVVRVGADDDRMGADAVEHRLPRARRQAVDGRPEAADRVARLPHGRTVGEQHPRRQAAKGSLR